MGLIDTEQLLVPFPGSQPSGPNLEYDPAFAALERAALGKPEQRMGNAVVPGEPPDWASVLDQSVALLQRTRDLRVAVHLTNALLQRSGYVGFCEGLRLVRGMLEGFWPSVHPELDPEENDDPTMRINALAALGTPAMINTLRATPLARARAFGAVSLRDIQALANGAPSEGGVDAATVEAVFQEVEFEALEEVERAVRECREHLAAIDTVFETNTGSRGPDWAPLSALLREVGNVLGPRVAARRGAAAPEAAPADGDGSPGGQGAAAPPRGEALAGEVRSREDVVRAIDKICAYYARYEPTSPLPLLLERCKRLVNASFLDIIRDLAPDSVSQVERLAGTKPE